MSSCPPPKRDDCPAYPPLDGCAIDNSLARKLIPVANKLRQQFEKFGLRPYRVLLVKTRWSGGVRGEGQEEVTQERELRPTPLVSALDALTETVFPIGDLEQGSLSVTEINGLETEDSLRGFSVDGLPLGPDEQVFFEIEFLKGGRQPSDRRRFTLRGVPTYASDEFMWKLRLERSFADRTQQGAPG